MSDRWEWTKRFRVWEARRKHFEMPENWLEPEATEDEALPPPRPLKRSRLLRRRRAKPEPDDGS